MKTEYLIPINKENDIATSCTSFNHLLMSNNGIDIKDSQIDYNGLTFKYVLQDNSISDTNIICYHITIECSIPDSDFDTKSDTVKTYLELLKIVRSTFTKCTEEFEILWDDVSYLCSQKAYPLIYEIENLMRKLLTKFMLINVGSKWEKENIPSKIKKSKNKEKDINVGNGLLYQLDFIELSTFLFEPYSLKSSINDLKRNIDNQTDISYSLLENYFQKSNWERYFSNVVTVENEHLSKKWQELYALRCKIAHNNSFSTSDYDKVKSIVDDLKPSIEAAINELDKITVDDDNKEVIYENLAKKTNEQVGSFILAFNKLHEATINFLSKKEVNTGSSKGQIYSMQRLITTLQEKGYVDDNQYKFLNYLCYIRNKIVHQADLSIENDLDKMILQIDELLPYFQISNMKGE